MSFTTIPGIKEQVDQLVFERTNEGAGVSVTYLWKAWRPAGQDRWWEERVELFPDMDAAQRAARELADGGARCIRIERR